MLAVLLLTLLQSADDEARAAIERAEDAARAGRYAEARAAYERAAKRYAGTPLGALAERRAQPSAFLGWDWVVQNGPSSNRVDVVLMGDGYELPHLKNFVKLAADIPPLFERNPTFREYLSYFNFLRADLVSADNGVDGFGREYDTALDAKTGETYAGHVVINRARVQAMLDELPEHDDLAICFVRNGVLGTGGSGFATIGGREFTTTVHEWGHAFGGLGDEYETQQSAHQGAPGRAPNVSDTPDPAKVPWAHWLEAKVPGIGVVEGAAARAKGAWKPTSSGCTMSSGERFCVVCQEALVLRIHRYVDPIDECTPEPQDVAVREPYRLGDEPLELRVKVMRPATHQLEVTWWILPGERFVGTGSGAESGGAGGGFTGGFTGGPRRATGGSFGVSAATGRGGRGPADRAQRGPLPPIEQKPFRVDRVDPDAVHVLKLEAKALEPGRYRVVVRAKDPTKLRGERWPMVLKDELGLLESERGWWIEVPAR